MVPTDTRLVLTDGVFTAQLDAVDVPARHADPGERGARDTLRTQIRRLEHELSMLIVGAFPHVRPRDQAAESLGGPRLLSLGELERVRDELVDELRDVERQAHERAEIERRSRARLQRMALEPAHHKFARVEARDVGGICGVWQVRPRFGLLGMLAGWWELKLSSGCP